MKYLIIILITINFQLQAQKAMKIDFTSTHCVGTNDASKVLTMEFDISVKGETIKIGKLSETVYSWSQEFGRNPNTWATKYIGQTLKLNYYYKQAYDMHFIMFYAPSISDQILWCFETYEEAEDYSYYLQNDE